MKTMIVYYSLEGNTDYAAKKIAERTGAKMLRLIPQNAYQEKGFGKFFRGGKSAIMGDVPALETYDVDLADYDRIIFGFPVWAGNFTPPLRTFIIDQREALKGKNISAFACQGGAGGEKALAKLARFLRIKAFEETAIFIEPKARRSSETEEAIASFCGRLGA